MTAAIGLKAFRDAFAEVPMPVAVATAARSERPYGTTVSSFCSLSAAPPLVAAALDRRSTTLGVVLETRRFGLNVLAEGQEWLARRCATKTLGKLDEVERRSVDGLPRIHGVAVWLACSLREHHAAGDHVLLVGLVTGSSVEPATPLLYHRRGFATPWNQPGD